MDTKFLDIEKENRHSDFDQIHKGIERAEVGVGAICIMYDEHSDDKNSFENILRLKQNIHYRLSSARFQYRIFLQELYKSEHYLLELLKKDSQKFDGFIMGNPFFERIEAELSSIFDGIIFNITSVFDYFSHIICYICKSDKQSTVYWNKLAKLARGKDNEIGKLKIATVIDDLDRKFIGRLYDYRSRLIHNERDEHKFSGTEIIEEEKMDFNINILSSHILLSKKYLKIVKDENPNFDEITLTYTSSWLIRKTLNDIELLINALVIEIKSNSFYQENLRVKKKGKSRMMGTIDPKTNRMTPLSEIMWKQYVDQKN